MVGIQVRNKNLKIGLDMIFDWAFEVSVIGCIFTLLGIYWAGSTKQRCRMYGFVAAFLGVFVWMYWYYLIGWEMCIMSIFLNAVLAIFYIRGMYNNRR